MILAPTKSVISFILLYLYPFKLSLPSRLSRVLTLASIPAINILLSSQIIFLRSSPKNL